MEEDKPLVVKFDKVIDKDESLAVKFDQVIEKEEGGEGGKNPAEGPRGRRSRHHVTMHA